MVFLGSNFEQTPAYHVSTGSAVIWLDQVFCLWVKQQSAKVITLSTITLVTNQLSLYQQSLKLSEFQYNGFFLLQSGSLGMLSGHLADYLQCTGAPPRSHEGLVKQNIQKSSDYHSTVELQYWSILCLQRVTGCILSNVNTPSTTPVIGQPQNTTSPIYQNSKTANKPTAGK